MKTIFCLTVCFFVFHYVQGQQLVIQKSEISLEKYYSKTDYVRKKARLDSLFKDREDPPSIIDSSGTYIFEGLLDGESSGFVFYSNSGEKLNQYRPYPFFNNFYQDVRDKKFVLIASENQNSPRYKVAILNTSGNLIVEKEFERNIDILRGIRILNDRIVVFGIDRNNLITTIICLDDQLNVVWEKTVNDFIHYFGFLASEKNNVVVLLFKNNLMCLDAKTGMLNWRKSPEALHGALNFRPMFGDLVFQQKNVAVITYQAESIRNVNKTLNNELFVIELASGEVRFHEKIGSSSNKLEFVNEDPFKMNDNYFIVKSEDKAWLYKLNK